MKISIAGKDGGEGLAGRLAAGVDALRRHPDAPEFLPMDYSALRLRDAGTEAEYLRRLLDLVRRRAELSTMPVPVPHGRGFLRTALARVRCFLWRLLRYQHDRMAFQQNIINTQITAALEFLRAEQTREIEELRGRVEELTRRIDNSHG